jgi:hypothetical protein
LRLKPGSLSQQLAVDGWQKIAQLLDVAPIQL